MDNLKKELAAVEKREKKLLGLSLIHILQIAFGKKQDAQKANKLASILQTIHEGVIVTDEHGLISEFNTSAEHILKISRGDVMGKQVSDVLPNTRLNVVIERRQAEYNKIQEVGNVKILTNRCPIFSNGKLVGALATFQNVDDVSEACLLYTSSGSLRPGARRRGWPASRPCTGRTSTPMWTRGEASRTTGRRPQRDFWSI